MSIPIQRNNVGLSSDVLNRSDKENQNSAKTLSIQYPTARWKHAAVIYKDFLYIMGGYTWTSTLKDLWRLNLNELNREMSEHFKPVGLWNSIDSFSITANLWQNLSRFIDGISPLTNHSMVAHDNQLFIFGGAFTFDAKNCPFWIFDIDTKTMTKWKSPDLNASVPIPRRNHSCCMYRNAMVIFGGFGDVRGSLGDLWIFDIDSKKWHLMWSNKKNTHINRRNDLFHGPCCRHDHRAVVHQRNLLIFGGMNGLEMCNDLWQWSFDECQWTKLAYKGDHGDMSYLIDVKIKNYWVFFGINDVKKKTEKWMYSFSQNKWIMAPFHIPQFYRFSTLLAYRHSQTIQNIHHMKRNQISKLNKIYPVSYESLDSITEKNDCESIHLSNHNLTTIKPSGGYQRLDSCVTTSKETLFTTLTDSMNYCETTFINNPSEDEVQIDRRSDRGFLLVLGNNIENASFDHCINMQLMYM